jgi:HAD superfamily hydrolase (TIGR01549 family)
VLCEASSDPALTRLVERFIEAIVPLGANGVFNVQVLVARGKYYLSDVNPRIGTSAVLAKGNGVRLVRFLCRAYLESRHEIVAPPARGATGMVMLRVLDEVWIDRRDLAGIRGVVFDLDDTLLDQKKWMFEKFAITWDRHAHELPPKQDFLRCAMQIVEEGNRSTTFDVLCRQLGLDDVLKDELMQTYRDALPDRDVLYADAKKTLFELRQRGYALALLSDNPARSQWQKIRRMHLEPCFDAIVLSRELGTEKPAAQCFAATAKQLNLRSAQLAMVGDNIFRDIDGAFEAGYGQAFLIRRAGALFNFDEDTAAKIGRCKSYVALDRLTDMLWYLPAA